MQSNVISQLYSVAWGVVLSGVYLSLVSSSSSLKELLLMQEPGFLWGQLLRPGNTVEALNF